MSGRIYFAGRSPTREPNIAESVRLFVLFAPFKYYEAKMSLVTIPERLFIRPF